MKISTQVKNLWIELKNQFLSKIEVFEIVFRAKYDEVLLSFKARQIEP